MVSNGERTPDESFLYSAPSTDELLHRIDHLWDLREVSDRDASIKASALYAESDPRWVAAYQGFQEEAYQDYLARSGTEDTGDTI
jgi:hypothetical protein